MNTNVLAAALIAISASSLSAQVAHWRLVKGPFAEQTANNTQPASAVEWSASVYLGTVNAGDATSVTISGGGIVGSLPLESEGGGEWSLEEDFTNQAALNAMIPSSATYTLTVSGGTLGTLTQQFNLGVEQYPNSPYMTGTVFTAVQQYTAGAPFTLTWNNPGPLTQSSGVSVFSIFDRDDDEVYRDLTIGGAVSSTVPANTLTADDCFFGFLEFSNAQTVPGSVFGVTGTTSHNTAVYFNIGTFAYPTGPCATTETFGNSCDNLGLDGDYPILGTNWVLTTSGVTPNWLAFTLFGFGDMDPALPLSALGLNAPGCHLHVPLNSIVANLSGIAFGGQFVVTVAIPNSSSFAGLELTVQSAALTNANAAGIATSNGLIGALGN